MNQEIVNLLIQIPLAGVIVFMTLQFLKHLETLNRNTLDFLAQQAQINREFLATQRIQTNESLGRLAEEIKTLRITMHNGN